MKKIMFACLTLIVAGCVSAALEAEMFANDFERIPIGSSRDQVRKQFGRPSIVEAIPEKLGKNMMTLLYEKREFTCAVVFQDDLVSSAPFCVVNQRMREQLDDENRAARANSLSGIGNAFQNAGQQKQTTCTSRRNFDGSVRTVCD